MKVLSVVGARPQFVKAAVVLRALALTDRVDSVLVHTGQHFDANMSAVFFDELDLPSPDYNLGIGGGTHAENCGRMLEAIENVVLTVSPDWVLVFGDTDSTLAGALAAAKLNVAVAHVEAGLRSFNRRMPEEINRILTDHASTLLLAPTVLAVRNLADEGIGSDRVTLVGDVMYDAALYYGARAERRSSVLDRLGVRRGEYVLATVHRPANTDNLDNMTGILRAMSRSRHPVVWPVHPRTRNRLRQFGLSIPPTVIATEPVGYLDMAMLEKHALLVATDSGGVQKEAFFYGVPCVTLREETEWVELLEAGVNQLVGSDFHRFGQLLSEQIPTFAPLNDDHPYGNGQAAEKVALALVTFAPKG